MALDVVRSEPDQSSSLGDASGSKENGTDPQTSIQHHSEKGLEYPNGWVGVYKSVHDLDEFDAPRTRSLPLPSEQPDGLTQVNQFGGLLNSRMQDAESNNDIDKAIKTVKKAIDSSADDELKHIQYLSTLGNLLSQKHDRTREKSDLERAIDVSHAVVELLLEKPWPQFPVVQCLCHHAMNLGKRFIHDNDTKNLNLAISFAEKALRKSSSRLEIACCQFSLSKLLAKRSSSAGMPGELDKAIDAARNAVELTGRIDCLENLSTLLEMRFSTTRVIGDLDEALRVSLLLTRANPTRAQSILRMSRLLGKRYNETADLKSLDAGIDLAKKALVASSPSSFDEGETQMNLSLLLEYRFEATWNMDDIDEAIRWASKGCEAPNCTAQIRAERSGSLGGLFTARFWWCTKADTDINRAIDICATAVDRLSSPRARGACAANLGAAFHFRYRHLGMKADLNCAIQSVANAVELMPKSDVQRPRLLSSLADLFRERSVWTGIVDNDRAIYRAEEALSLSNLYPRDRPHYLFNLSQLLYHRFQKAPRDKKSDLDRSLEITRELIESERTGSPGNFITYLHLGHIYYARYLQNGQKTDLILSLEAYENSLQRAGEMDRGSIMLTLGYTWIDVGDLDCTTSEGYKAIQNALRMFYQGFICEGTSISTRIQLAHALAVTLICGITNGLNWDNSTNLLKDSVSLLDLALKLLPALNPRFSPNTDKQRRLSRYFHLASTACELALRAGKEGYDALKLLELGRNVINSHLLDIRIDITALQRVHPSLAKEFSLVRTALDSSEKMSSMDAKKQDYRPWVTQGRRRITIEREFHKVVEKIRNQPGLQAFLLPPSEEDMVAAAELGPIVVINVGIRQSDAFLITRDGIRVMNLPRLQQEEVDENVRRMSRDLMSETTAFRIKGVLEWLWEVIACPVLEALGFTEPCSGDNWPRLWWVPTGALCQLPLHAAGRIFEGSQELVLFRVMSCYAVSVKALIYARRCKLTASKPLNSEHALALSMSETPDMDQPSDLPFAKDEVLMVEANLASLGLKPLRPPPRRKEVLESLRYSKIFHFAGHGASDALEPAQSRLLLEDWKTDPLTVDDLRDMWIQETSPFLCYLSACSTGANQVEVLFEEGVHLISSFQQAGFRHVIGTLWNVSDKHCVDVAKVFYESLLENGLTDEAVANGYHRATKTLAEADLAGRAPYPHETVTRVTGEQVPTSVLGLSHRMKALNVLSHEVSQEVYGIDQIDRGEQTKAGTTDQKRDGTLLVAGQGGDQCKEPKWESPLYWVPYMHFGV